MKVLHCPSDTGSNAWFLSQAERQLGLDSRVAVFHSQWFNYPADIKLHFEKVSRLRKEWRRWKFFFSSLKQYDIFHFNMGSSLIDYWKFGLPYLDVPFLKKAGKKIIITFQGCEIRLKESCRSDFSLSACAECDIKQCTPAWDDKKRKKIRKISECAHRLYAMNPDLIHGCPRAEFLPYSNVDITTWTPRPAARFGRKIKIIHTPTNRSIKGTKYVIKTVEQLKQENYPVELVLVENTPHQEVKKLYHQADIMIDQLLVGWYGGFAVEAMALGKPVLAYLREEDLKFVPFRDQIPIVRTSPQTLADDLKPLIADAKLRKTVGERGRAYVEEFHDPLKIASRMIKTYQSC